MLYWVIHSRSLPCQEASCWDVKCHAECHVECHVECTLIFFLSIKIELSIAMCILLNNKLFLTKDHRPLSSLRLKILVQYSCNTIYGQNAIIKRQCSSRGWPFLHKGLQKSIRTDIQSEQQETQSLLSYFKIKNHQVASDIEIIRRI